MDESDGQIPQETVCRLFERLIEACDWMVRAVAEIENPAKTAEALLALDHLIFYSMNACQWAGRGYIDGLNQYAKDINEEYNTSVRNKDYKSLTDFLENAAEDMPELKEVLREFLDNFRSKAIANTV